MLEITSSFRISLDFFGLATFGANYGLQIANKAITGCTKVAVRYFGPFSAKLRLEMLNTLVFFSPRRKSPTDPEILVAIVG